MAIPVSQMALPSIPDNLTIPQFFLDAQNPAGALRKDTLPWLIEDSTGRTIGIDEVCLYDCASASQP